MKLLDESLQRITGWHVMEACKKHNWCTTASREQYEKMLKAVDRKVDLIYIVHMIWVLSENVKLKEIKEVLSKIERELRGEE